MKSPWAVPRYTLFGLSGDNTVHLYIMPVTWLGKYNEIWEKVENSIKKEFYSEPVYSEKHLKDTIKSYNGNLNTNFYNNKISKESSHHICLSIILIDSV